MNAGPEYDGIEISEGGAYCLTSFCVVHDEGRMCCLPLSPPFRDADDARAILAAIKPDMPNAYMVKKDDFFHVNDTGDLERYRQYEAELR